MGIWHHLWPRRWCPPPEGPRRDSLVPMLRKLFLVVVVVLIGVIAFVLLAPQTPDGSWINEAGEKISNGLKAFWGNPIAP